MKRISILILVLCTCLVSAAWPQAQKQSPEPTKPLWQSKLKVQGTDFIEFVSKDRVLVGTIDNDDLGGGPIPRELMMLNSASGETVWTVPRGPFGSGQTLMDVNPVILMEGGKQLVALNPENGTRIWSQEPELSLLLSNKYLVLLNRRAHPMTLSAVNVKTGSEAWKTPLENYPGDKNTKLALSSMGGAVLLTGPDAAAFSASDGKLLWRMPFPGTLGPKAQAIPLGDDLYFSDGSTITRSDPASGKEMWRAPLSNGTFQALTAIESGVFILLKGSGENPPDSIAALDRNTGKPLWKSGLLDRAASPINIVGDRLYVTTPGSVIAMKTSDGSVMFKAEIPSNLQSRRQLPDQLRIANDRIIVARENGVLAVQKSDGKLLFADQVAGGEGFTYDFSTSRFRHAIAPLAGKNSASPEDNYRVAMAQQLVADDMLRAFTTSRMAWTNFGVYGHTPTPQELRTGGTVALVGAIANSAEALGGAINHVILQSTVDFYQERVQDTFRTHASSLQGKFYLRPTYEQHIGWSLHVVDLETGKHTNLLLSSDADETPDEYATHLPAFSTDGSRIVSKGLGPNPDWHKVHKSFLSPERVISVRDVGAYPSVLAFDLASLPFTQNSNIEVPLSNPVDPQKSKLNDQLLAAAPVNDVNAVRRLLDAGANVNAADAYGNTALMLAAEVRSKGDVVKLLLERGADADIRDPSGLTALERTNLLPPFSREMMASIKAIKKAQKEHQ